MKGKDLKFLAVVTDLARLDIEAASITLAVKDGRIRAAYQGAYSAGWRRLAVDSAEEFMIPLSVPRLKAAAALLDDDEDVKLRPARNSLSLKTSDSTITLQAHGEGVADLAPPRSIDFGAKLPAAKMLEEMNIASSFVSDSLLQAILTGIRLEITDGRIGVSSYNGFGAFFLSDLQATTRNQGDVVVPTQDFIVGLRLAAAEEITVAVAGEKVYVYNPNAYFESSTLTGVWPDVEKVTNEDVVRTIVKVRGRALKRLASSAKALVDLNEVTFVNNNGSIMAGGRSDVGEYFTVMAGTLPARLTFDADLLSKATQLGDDLELAVPASSGSPALITAGARQCFLVTKIS